MSVEAKATKVAKDSEEEAAMSVGKASKDEEPAQPFMGPIVVGKLLKQRLTEVDRLRSVLLVHQSINALYVKPLSK